MGACITWIKKRPYILFAIIALGGCISTTLPPEVPLPINIRILPPDPALPEEVKLLSGKWAGEIPSMTPWRSRIVIERLEDNSAEIVYAHSGHHNDAGGPVRLTQCHCAPSWERMKGDISHAPGTATLGFATSTGKMSLTVKKDQPDLVEGYLKRRNVSYPVRMNRLHEE